MALRLPASPAPPGRGRAAGPGPVVLFLPANDEEATVAASADAEIVHDYNYAQVLTLDLLAKGYRYLEVPIAYGFRTSGRSFVRPLCYLRRVAPAVWRELNSAEFVSRTASAQPGNP